MLGAMTQLRDIMTEDVLTVAPEDTLGEVATKMVERNVGSVVVFDFGRLIGVLTDTLTPLLIGLPVVALAGAIVLTLPQALAFTLAPAGSEGAAAGLLDFSRGIGVVLGPIVVGAAVSVSQGVFESTRGYGSMWLIIGVPVLIAGTLLKPLEATEGA